MTKPASIDTGAELDLTTIDREVRLEPSYERDGHTARTLVRNDELRIVLIAMKAGSRIAEHRSSAKVSIQTLRGHARLRLADRVVELPVGHLLVLEGGVRHDVEATTETALLLTLGRLARA